MTSREKILQSVRNATRTPAQTPEPPADLEQRLNDAIIKAAPKGKAQLMARFKAELECVSGEIHSFKKPADAARIIANIMNASGLSDIVHTDETMCQGIALALHKMKNVSPPIKPTPLPEDDRKARCATIGAALVSASYGAAETGSLAFPYDHSGTSMPHFLSDCVFAILSPDKLLTSISDVLDELGPGTVRNMVFMTGPSRTADIEKVLILGAHGPRRLVVLIKE